MSCMRHLLTVASTTAWRCLSLLHINAAHLNLALSGWPFPYLLQVGLVLLHSFWSGGHILGNTHTHHVFLHLLVSCLLGGGGGRPRRLVPGIASYITLYGQPLWVTFASLLWTCPNRRRRPLCITSSMGASCNVIFVGFLHSACDPVSTLRGSCEASSSPCWQSFSCRSPSSIAQHAARLYILVCVHEIPNLVPRYTCVYLFAARIRCSKQDLHCFKSTLFWTVTLCAL